MIHMAEVAFPSQSAIQLYILNFFDKEKKDSQVSSLHSGQMEGKKFFIFPEFNVGNFFLSGHCVYIPVP